MARSNWAEIIIQNRWDKACSIIFENKAITLRTRGAVTHFADDYSVPFACDTVPLPILVLHMEAATSWEPSREIIANELV
jgi:hypothetical protein